MNRRDFLCSVAAVAIAPALPARAAWVTPHLAFRFKDWHNYAVFENLPLADFGERIPTLHSERFPREGSP